MSIHSARPLAAAILLAGIATVAQPGSARAET